MRVTGLEYNIGTKVHLRHEGLCVSVTASSEGLSSTNRDLVLKALETTFDELSNVLKRLERGEEVRGTETELPSEELVQDPFKLATVPDISEENRAKLTQMVNELNTLSEALKAPSAQGAPSEQAPVLSEGTTGFEFAPTPKAEKATEELEEDPLAEWMTKSNGPKGTMTRREARSQVQWERGMTYRGSETIIQCGVDESSNPHGAVWTLTLSNGDVVTTDLFGKELQYEISEDVDAAPVRAHPAPAPLEETSVGKDVIPDAVRNTVKGNRVFAWLIDQDPRLAKDPGGIVQWCIDHQSELKAFKGMDEAKILRRVETVLPSLMAQA